jgi:hypothetical protein
LILVLINTNINNNKMKFLILNEPNQNTKINNNLLMKITGSDTVNVRSLFSKKIIKSKL